MEGRVLPWPAGMGRRTPWTTRYYPSTLSPFNVWQIPAIARFYATVYGDEEDAMEDPAATIVEVEGGSKAVGDHQVHKTS